MAMHHRLRRLERVIVANDSGVRACMHCRNGEEKRVIFLMEGEPMYGGSGEALCLACGRDIAYIFNIVKAEDPRRPAPP